MSCRLCFYTGNDLLEVFEDEGIDKILKKHFSWLTLSQLTDDPSPYICNKCWVVINDFDIFCCKIEEKHLNFPSIVQRNVNDEVKNEPNFYFLKCDSFIKAEALTDLEIFENSISCKYSETVKNPVKNENNFDLTVDVFLENAPESSTGTDVNKLVTVQAKITSGSEKSNTSLLEIEANDSKLEEPIVATNEKNINKKSEKVQEFLKKCLTSNKWAATKEVDIKQMCKMECTLCQEHQFDNWQDMKKHYRVEHSMDGFTICSCCDVKFTQKSKILDHVVYKLNPEEFQCKICDINYRFRTSIVRHNEDYHANNTTQMKKKKDPHKNIEISEKIKESKAWGDANEKNIKQFCKLECTICVDKRFDNFHDMKMHYLVTHKMQGFVICSCCNQKFTKRPTILDHIMRKIKPEEFRCRICGKYFNSRFKLIKHERIHNADKLNPFKCEACPKTFRTQLLFSEHLTSHLPDSEKKFGCLQCKLRYHTEAKLNIHVQRCHPTETQKFLKMCEECGRTFSCTKYYEQHKSKVHLKVPQLSVQCHFCEKWYRYEFMLSHLRVYHRNNAEKDRTCSICQAVLVTIPALRLHMKSVHMSVDKMHHCTICDKKFKRKDHFNDHQAIHTGAFLYTCYFCPQMFRSNANMYKHMKIKHTIPWQERKNKNLKLSKTRKSGSMEQS